MGYGFKRGAGGGTELNFKVIVGTAEPDVRENTVWLVTDIPVREWVFSPVQPEEADGLAWILTGLTSAAAFNAIRKNGIMLYPVSAKVFSGGWIDVKVKSVKNGAWVDWWVPGTLFENGIDDTEVTGGWDSFAYSVGSGFDGKKISVEMASDGIFASFPNAKLKSTFVGTNSRVDVSSYTKLSVTFSEARRSTANGAIKVVLYSDAGYTVAAQAMVISTSGETNLDPEIDVSKLSGSYFIGFFMWAWDACDLSARMTLARLS